MRLVGLAEVDTNARCAAEGMTALAEGGFYGLCIDTAFGGQRQGPVKFAAVAEERARQCGSTASVRAATTRPLPHLQANVLRWD